MKASRQCAMEIERQRDGKRVSEIVTDVSTSGLKKERGFADGGVGGGKRRVEYRERTEKLNLGINHAISISLPTFLAAALDISEIHPVTRQ